MLNQRASSKNKAKQHKIWHDFFWGLGLSLASAVLGSWFNQQPLGKDFTWLTFRLIQRQITPDRDRLSKIAVVDISELRPDQKTGVTPRRELQHLLSAIANQNPRVIGIDIDFSPEEVAGEPAKRQFVSPEDPAFFEFCSSLKFATRRIPVYLGVSRTERMPPEQWLAFSEYQPLAADLAVPVDNRRAIESLASRDAKSMHGEEAFQKARTMSVALAREVPNGREAKECTWPLERSRDNQFYVDYSPIHSFTVIGAESLSTQAALDQLRDKMVILGDVSEASDRFTDPFSPAPVAGVLVQAAAAYTAMGPALCDIKEPLRELADLIVAFVILLLLTLARLYWIKEEQKAKERWHSILQAVAVLLVLGLGLSVNRSHVVWDDFLFVAIAIALDPFADSIFELLREGIPGKKHV